MTIARLAESGIREEFPGRWFGGVSLLLGPLLLLSGVSLRFGYDFFFPAQLEAVQSEPALMETSYSMFAAGVTLLIPAVLLLGKRIAASCPSWAFWGAALTVFGLVARIFHAGIDHLAFQLVRVQGAAAATQVIADSYGSFHIFKTFNLAIMLGWVVLAAGCYRSRVFNLAQSLALASTSLLPLGVLKGSTVFSLAAAGGLCLALIPLGAKVLREGPQPAPVKRIGWSVGSIALLVVFYLFGQAG